MKIRFGDWWKTQNSKIIINVEDQPQPTNLSTIITLLDKWQKYDDISYTLTRTPWLVIEFQHEFREKKSNLCLCVTPHQQPQGKWLW